jgi:hypothetical protein
VTATPSYILTPESFYTKARSFLYCGLLCYDIVWSGSGYPLVGGTYCPEDDDLQRGSAQD